MALSRLRLLAIEAVISPAMTVRWSFRHRITGADISNFSESVTWFHLLSVSLLSLFRALVPRKMFYVASAGSGTFPEPDERSEIGYFSFSLRQANSEFSWFRPLYCLASPVFFLQRGRSRMRSSILIERRKTTTTSWKPRRTMQRETFSRAGILVCRTCVCARVLTESFFQFLRTSHFPAPTLFLCWFFASLPAHVTNIRDEK